MAVTFSVVDLSVDPDGTGGGVSFSVVTLGEAGSGGGAVDSVNDQTGVVVLDAADVGADPAGSASTAQAAAIAAAATDATTKANAAQSAATSAAATDATSKVATETTRATTAEALLAPKASPTFAGTVSGITKTMVGLGNVDNTADASKPVSTLQAAADTAIGTAAATDATTKANAAQAAAIQRANHTGTQAISTVTGLQTALDGKETAGAAATAQAAAIAASQPVDSDLTAIAALTTTSFGRSVLTQADAAALRSLAGLGTAATQASSAFDSAGAASAAQAASQPLDSDLTAIAALTTTSFGRSFLALADAAAGRTLLGLGTAAVLNTGTSSGDIPLLSTGGRLPIARIASGTPDGTKFVRDDGTLVTPSGGGGGAVATDTIFDAKGDLPVGTGSDTAAKLTAGTNGQVLTADSTQTTGLKYAAANPWTTQVDLPLTSLTNWTGSGTGASWGLTGTGSVIRDAASPGNNVHTLNYGVNVPLDDILIEVEIMMNSTNNTASSRAGILFTDSTATIGAQVTLLAGVAGNTTAVDYEYSGTTSLGQYALGANIAHSTWITFRARKTGSAVSAWVNGTFVGSADIALGHSRRRQFCFYTYAADASFRNLKVYVPTVP